MVKRTIKLPKTHSFFLLGPRQTGKSTLLHNSFPAPQVMKYDLLRTSEYLRLSENPALFGQEVRARASGVTHVIVDEVQRIPELLNEVHSLIESPNAPFFILSGSSARKLKKSHANLLAGRAWTYHLYPLTHRELGESFSIERAMNFGTLPSVYLSPDEDARKTLKAYVETYLKEEIEQEALVRRLGTFLRFLTLAAHENGNIINYSNIARETGASYQTVKEYFNLLGDTLIGFLLPPYSRSARKRLIRHPKFYFFDTGVCRALTKQTSVPLQVRTSEFGRTFEHFVITEIIRLTEYKEADYQFSFYHTSNHAETDLVIETPKGRTVAIELKASVDPDSSALSGLRSFRELCPKAELYCACLAPRRRVVDGIIVDSWREIVKDLGLVSG